MELLKACFWHLAIPKGNFWPEKDNNLQNKCYVGWTDGTITGVRHEANLYTHNWKLFLLFFFYFCSFSDACSNVRFCSWLWDYLQQLWVKLICTTSLKLWEASHAVHLSSLHWMDYWSQRLWSFPVQPSRSLFWFNVDLCSLSRWCFSPPSAAGSTSGHTHSCGTNHTDGGVKLFAKMLVPGDGRLNQLCFSSGISTENEINKTEY